jgi:L-2-hydroxyglutarate oxidase LhgO
VSDPNIPPRSAESADVVVIGGGIVGLTVAVEIKRRLDVPRVVLLEKEKELGCHASGRNSGVLHAGFYYAADSLKARLCRDGNRALTEYCLERNLPINRCGKLVVATEPSEVAGVDELFRRGRLNGVDVTLVTEEEARDIDPAVRTVDRALWSPTTSSVDPSAVVSSLEADARALGIRIRTATPFVSARDSVVTTPGGSMSAGYVVNAAGLYADSVARHWGFAQDHTILPFKGL